MTLLLKFHSSPELPHFISMWWVFRFTFDSMGRKIKFKKNKPKTILQAHYAYSMQKQF